MTIESVKEQLRSVASNMRSLSLTYHDAQKIIEREMLKLAASESRGNQCRMADLLGVHRNTIPRLMEEHGIDLPRSQGHDGIPRPKPPMKERRHTALRYIAASASAPKVDKRSSYYDLARELYPNYEDIVLERDYPQLAKAE